MAHLSVKRRHGSRVNEYAALSIRVGFVFRDGGGGQTANVEGPNQVHADDARESLQAGGSFLVENLLRIADSRAVDGKVERSERLEG